MMNHVLAASALASLVVASPRVLDMFSTSNLAKMDEADALVHKRELAEGWVQGAEPLPASGNQAPPQVFKMVDTHTGPKDKQEPQSASCMRL